MKSRSIVGQDFADVGQYNELWQIYIRICKHVGETFLVRNGAEVRIPKVQK